MNFGTNGFSLEILFAKIEKHLEHNLHLFKIQDVKGDKINRPFAPFRKWTLDKDLFFICEFNEVQYIFKLNFVYCSDFCNESNGILVLGVVSFQTNFDFLTTYF